MGWKERPYNQDETGGIPRVVFSFPKIRPLTLWVLIACTVIFVAQRITRSYGSPLEHWGWLTFHDAKALTQPWRWVTYQYLHGGVAHFFFNMIGVFFFLPTLELLWGWKKAFAFYTAGGVVAGAAFGILVACLPSLRNAPFDVPLVGASGSIFAAMGAVALLMPERQLILLFFPLPIRAAVALFAVYFAMTTLLENDLSDACHLGGLAFGFLGPYLGAPFWHRKSKNWERGRARRLVEDEIAEQQTVDRILQKVHDSGMNSLTRGERKTLKIATERQRVRDVELAKTRAKGWR